MRREEAKLTTGETHIMGSLNLEQVDAFLRARELEPDNALVQACVDSLNNAAQKPLWTPESFRKTFDIHDLGELATPMLNVSRLVGETKASQ